MREVQPKGYVPEPTIRASLANGFQVFSDDVVPFVVVAFFVITLGGVCRGLIAFEAPFRYAGFAATLLAISTTTSTPSNASRRRWSFGLR